METHTIDFTDSLNLNQPFLLFIGRKSHLISEPSRLQRIRRHLESTDEVTGLVEEISDAPIIVWFDLFIGEAHFSTTHVDRRGYAVKLVKPTGRHKKRPFEIHLTKKYTRLY